MARNISLTTGEIYHVFNRGVEKRNIFSRDIDYTRFLVVLALVNRESSRRLHLERIFKKYGQHSELSKMLELEGVSKGGHLAEILAWCLMPNHFHLLLRQTKDDGISILFHRLQNSHSHYYNEVYKRTGALFGGPFKAVHVDMDQQFTHNSRYLHLNPLELFDPQWKERGYVEDKEGAIKFLKGYKWSSLAEYLGTRQKFAPLIDKTPVMEYFNNNSEEYWKFLMEWIESESTGQHSELSISYVIDFDK